MPAALTSYQQPEKLACWHVCDRKQATQLLLSGACKPGTYMLRPCHSRAEKYALSVLQESRGFIFHRSKPTVRHYLIKEKENCGGYYIWASQCFKEVHHLLAYYAKRRRRQHAALRFPFPRAPVPDTGGGGGGGGGHRADKARNVQLLQKIGEGSYEIFSAELNGARVVSLVLDGGHEIPTLRGGAEPAPPKLPRRPSEATAAAAAAAAKADDGENKLMKLPPGEQLGQLVHAQKDGTRAMELMLSACTNDWSLARDQIDRCGRFAGKMLQKLFK